MKKLLVITIDVEPDCTPNWTYSSPLTFNGVRKGISEILQPLFNEYNITPTYLINNVVLEDDASINVFKTLQGNFELGTHLHPEFIEPEKKHADYSGKKGVANCCFYEPRIESEKIRNITTLFHHKFGYRPTSFRAGRFSAGDNTIQTLSSLNYKVDTSVTPNVRWDDKSRERPVDFRSAPNQPYFVDKHILRPEPAGPLLQVPVTIARKKLSAIEYLKYVKRNKRIPYKGSQPYWLRPVFSSTDDYRNIIQDVDEMNNYKQFTVYNMMFHNVEVMPGLSPYTLTAADCRKYLESLEWLFTYCNDHDIQSVALSTLYDVFKEQ